MSTIDVRPGQIWRSIQHDALLMVVKKTYVKPLGIDYYTCVVVSADPHTRFGRARVHTCDSIGSMGWELISDA